MSFACRGITHCDECGTTLRRDEFVICDICRERAKEKNKQTASANKDKVIKKYIGYELMQAIAEGKIKEGTKFKNLDATVKNDNEDIYTYKNNNLIGRHGGTNLVSLLNCRFELIEDEEIDIQEVASIKYNFDAVKDINEAFKTFAKLLGMQSDKINELVRAVKQLDKRTRKEKE